MKRFKAANISMLVLVACLFLVLNSYSFGQSFPPNALRKGVSNSHTEDKSATYAPVGPSGYKVLIPEIKMNQIVGEVKPKPRVPEPEPVQDTPVADEGAKEDTKERIADFSETHATETESSAVNRLPFDPSARKVSPSPVKEHLSHDFKRKIDSETIGPPLAPINITEALPEPQKEMLPKRQQVVVPKVKELPVSKIQSQVSSVKFLESQQVLAPEDWVGFQARKEPDELPLDESKTEVLVKEPQPSETIETPVKESIQAEVEDQKQTVSETPVGTVETEKHAVQEPKDVSGEITDGRVAVNITPEKPIPSPLDDEALTEKGTRLYLSEITPVIEELSLLMARAPSLSLADYDPSEINVAVAPQDLPLKLESMKRELRILDSRIFSIIAPSNYSQFHDLIRQAISQTYLACEAITNYFQDSRPEDLHKVNDHLVKARELIKLTRKSNGST
jgi:nitrogen regulatory protein PII-like uncharacterized protein